MHILVTVSDIDGSQWLVVKDYVSFRSATHYGTSTSYADC